MIKTKHTPGPWSVEIDEWKEGSGSISIPEIERTLHDSEWADRKDWERDLANAHLISAAPEMLQALERVQKFLSHDIDSGTDKYIAEKSDELQDLILLVIQKAKGGA